jgi:DNA-binding FadR family transcriptional regulator
MSTDHTALPQPERPSQPAQVARHLLEMINHAQLRPGDKVPSEVRIGKGLQVSRGNVREANRSLSALGILAIEGGRKPRLRVLDPNVLAQVFDYALKTAQLTVVHAHRVVAEASGNPLNALLLGALRKPVEASSQMPGAHCW